IPIEEYRNVARLGNLNCSLPESFECFPCLHPGWTAEFAHCSIYPHQPDQHAHNKPDDSKACIVKKQARHGRIGYDPSFWGSHHMISHFDAFLRSLLTELSNKSLNTRTGYRTTWG